MCGWGPTRMPPPAANDAGPAWSRKHHAPTVRRAALGSARAMPNPPPRSAWRAAMRCQGDPVASSAGGAGSGMRVSSDRLCRAVCGLSLWVARTGRAAILTPVTSGDEQATPKHGLGTTPHVEERFRLLVDSVQDYAIFMLDPQGRVLTWNKGAERLKGYAAHEIIGRSFEAFYLDDAVSSGWPKEELRLAMQRGRFEDEGWRVRK